MVTSGRGLIALMGVVCVSYRSGEVLIKGLPSLCKGPDEALLCTKVADVLTQLLVTGKLESMLLHCANSTLDCFSCCNSNTPHVPVMMKLIFQ